MSEKKLWGVKRPDGTMIQSEIRTVKWQAIELAAEKDDALYRTISDARYTQFIRAAIRDGYTIVRAAVVEVGEEG